MGSLKNWEQTREEVHSGKANPFGGMPESCRYALPKNSWSPHSHRRMGETRAGGQVAKDQIPKHVNKSVFISQLNGGLGVRKSDWNIRTLEKLPQHLCGTRFREKSSEPPASSWMWQASGRKQKGRVRAT